MGNMGRDRSTPLIRARPTPADLKLRRLGHNRDLDESVVLEAFSSFMEFLAEIDDSPLELAQGAGLRDEPRYFATTRRRVGRKSL
jgi:hypothetical protein